MRTLEAVQADVVIVIENERLFNDIRQDLPRFAAAGADVSVLRAPKSSGVAVRSSKEKAHAKMAKIREYFYGHAKDVRCEVEMRAFRLFFF